MVTRKGYPTSGSAEKKAAQPAFFESPAAFRAWLRANHEKADELVVGYYKRHTGMPSMTWPESVAEALCYGWIDGIRRRLDDDRYTIRFTPRRKGSKWSAINVRMVAELEAAGRLRKAGRAAFESRPESQKTGYSYPRKDGKLDATRLRAFKAKKAAWAFFEAQPPGYRRLMIHWVMAAKKDETKDRRMAKLIAASIKKQRIA